MLPYTEEYVAVEFKNKKTGKLVYVDFPVGVENDVNYDGSVKAFAFLLNNYCNSLMEQRRELMLDFGD